MGKAFIKIHKVCPYNIRYKSTSILNEEITPTLAKLKEERSTYLEYQKIQRELEHLTKLYIAWKFISAEETAAKADQDLDEVKANMIKLKQDIENSIQKIAEMTSQIAELQRTRDEELGGKLQELELALKEREKETMKAESALKANNDSKKQEEKKKQQITRSINTDKKALEEKQKETAGMQEMYDRLREEDRKCTEALKAAQKR